MTTFGEVSWNDDVFGGEGKKNANNKDLWLRLTEGTNEMRLVTHPFQYLVHKYKKAGDPGFGQKIPCSAMNGSCPLCSLGDKAKPRWLLGVISRKDNTYKILDISFAVFSQIRKLANNLNRWGDPTKYDIDIIVDKNGGATGYYSVQPLGKEALSAADQDIKDKADVEDLKRRVTPPDAAFVQKRMNKIDGIADGAAPAVAAKAGKPAGKVAQKAAPPAVSLTDDEEIAESFPSYDNGTQA